MTWTTDDLLTVEEAADVLGVGVQRMYNLRNLGEGSGVATGEAAAWCIPAAGWWLSWRASCGQR